MYQQKLFALLFESAPDAMVVVDQQGKIVLANLQTERLFGYQKKELREMAFEALMTEGFRMRHAGYFRSYFADPDTRPMAVGLELIGLRRNGTEFPIEMNLSPIKVGDSALVYSTIRDTTERKRKGEFATILEDLGGQKRLEEQLYQAQKMEALGKLAGGIAHDFNNLLTAIMGYSEILLGKLDANDPNRCDLREIKMAAERAASLTSQLLAFSRKQVLIPQVLDLNTVVMNIRKMLRRLISEDIEIFIRLEARLGKIKVDQGQLEQIIINLAVNARDAMPQGGKLIIETKNLEIDEYYGRGKPTSVVPGPYVMLAVSDTGQGMTPEVQARLFEPFFTTKELGRGTGLGLCTVYSIVKHSGGYIWVYSEPERGTTFKVYFPQIDEQVGEALEAQTLNSTLTGTETILLVEDDKSLRESIRTILQQHGYLVLEAEDGDEAETLSSGYQGPVHLLLTDVIMPGMSGHLLAQHLTKRRPELKVLYVSGYADHAAIHHGLLDPGSILLSKPFSPEALARKIREVLESEQTL